MTFGTPYNPPAPPLSVFLKHPDLYFFGLPYHSTTPFKAPVPAQAQAEWYHNLTYNISYISLLVFHVFRFNILILKNWDSAVLIVGGRFRRGRGGIITN